VDAEELRYATQHCNSFEDFFEWALEAFNVTGDPRSHFRHTGYARERPKDLEMYLDTMNVRFT
jgi:hypothetical protein